MKKLTFILLVVLAATSCKKSETAQPDLNIEKFKSKADSVYASKFINNKLK